MSIPTSLEHLVLECNARSYTAQLGGSGVSSINIEEGKTAVVWGLQIFPFFDLDTPLSQSSDIWRKTARAIHYFEFQAGEYRNGVIHRSNYRLDASPGPPSTTIPVPIDSPIYYPVYWIFKGRTINMRVMRPQPPSEKAAVIGIPTAQEAGAVAGYPGGYPVVVSMPGYGGLLEWNMDARAGIVTNNVSQPRPKPVLADDTGLLTPTANPVNFSAFTFPLVNLNFVILEGKNDL